MRGTSMGQSTGGAACKMPSPMFKSNIGKDEFHEYIRQEW